MDETVRRAKTLYFIGVGIAFAGGAQMAITLFTGRYFMAMVGALCVAVALRCCFVNGKIWSEAVKSRS